MLFPFCHCNIFFTHCFPPFVVKQIYTNIRLDNRAAICKYVFCVKKAFSSKKAAINYEPSIMNKKKSLNCHFSEFNIKAMTETLDIRITKSNHSRLHETDFDNLQFGKTFSDHMFVADYADSEWKNFEIVPYGEISLSPAISALHYGQSFFEGLKAYKHADGQVSVFRPDKNAARFNKSAERLCMPELPEDIFIQSIAALVDVDRDWIPGNANHSLYIRPFMFATDPFLGVAPSSTYKYMVLTGPTGPYFSKTLRVKIET